MPSVSSLSTHGCCPSGPMTLKKRIKFPWFWKYINSRLTPFHQCILKNATEMLFKRFSPWPHPAGFKTKPFRIIYHCRSDKHKKPCSCSWNASVLKKKSVRHIAFALLQMCFAKHATSALFLLQTQSETQRKGFPNLTVEVFLKGKSHNVRACFTGFPKTRSNWLNTSSSFETCY